MSVISVGINSALQDRIPYNDTPALVKIIGMSGIGKTLPDIPYAGITMMGVSWGINGSLAKTKALGKSVEIKIETEQMSGVLSGIKAIEKRIDEGKVLLYVLSDKLKKSLEKFQSIVGNAETLTDEAAKELDTSIYLIKSIKQVIETDICNADGYLTKHSGVIFGKIEQEVLNG